MHTVELLEEAEQAAAAAGVVIRQDWLGGTGGVCELRGKIVVFLDPQEPPRERLDLLVQALRLAKPTRSLLLSVGLNALVNHRRAA